MPAMGFARNLWYQGALLAFHADTSGGGYFYDKVTFAGNMLLTEMGVTAVKFIPHTCARRVDQTPECSANQ